MDNLDKQHLTNVNDTGTISNILSLLNYANIALLSIKKYFNLQEDSRTQPIKNV